jgi:hypothetical protein
LHKFPRFPPHLGECKDKNKKEKMNELLRATHIANQDGVSMTHFMKRIIRMKLVPRYFPNTYFLGGIVLLHLQIFIVPRVYTLHQLESSVPAVWRHLGKKSSMTS